MKTENQLARVNEFIEQLNVSSNPDGLVLLESEMDSIGAEDPLASYQNGGNCKNEGPSIGTCGSNKKACVNSSPGCINSTNGGDCENKVSVGNCLQYCY